MGGGTGGLEVVSPAAANSAERRMNDSQASALLARCQACSSAARSLVHGAVAEADQRAEEMGVESTVCRPFSLAPLSRPL